ncbi:50S ribosomal protein L18 [Desulfitibacter alkalitolerans]|uniref:50S ribosomal protein L18 n=1 Tax=Desulfitibacter alkalitolerans TaxID=264641 RepID=UPI00047FBE59|nr:50S ribosomal protein L18 [Desulfitibacter alkalitolerans]
MYKIYERNATRKKKHRRLRFRLTGTSERPRLNVFRSNSQMYAQIIDDTAGKTMVSASTLEKDIQEEIKGLNKKEAAKVVGKLVAKRAAEMGINKVVFDRGGYIYHGRVAALAEGAREGGLEF